jgi:LCP family protein required for cell wall assembly
MKIRINYPRFFQVVFSLIAIFCILLIGALVAMYHFNPALFSTSISMIAPIAIPQKPINVLVLGQDKVSGNTDVILMANVNPLNKKISIISIPRDTMVTYSSGRHFKINAAYKEDLSKDKIKEILGQTIDYQLVANPEGFVKIIDILGGVQVDVPIDMNYDDNDQNLHIHLKKGLQVLDGEKSEQFVRFRHTYVEGDLGRIDAQHIFFKAFVEQKLKPVYFLKANQVLNAVMANIKSEMPYSDILKYALFAKSLKPEDITFLTLPGEAKKTAGAWYFIHDPNATKAMMDQILERKQ